MTRFLRLIHHPTLLTRTLSTLMVGGLSYFFLCLRASPALPADNLFLLKELALYQERDFKPWRANPATRISLIWLARWFDWRQAEVVVMVADEASLLEAVEKLAPDLVFVDLSLPLLPSQWRVSMSLEEPAASHRCEPQAR